MTANVAPFRPTIAQHNRLCTTCVLQCVAVSCSELQEVAVSCSELQ